MARFQIGIVALNRNPHTPCFLDFAKALAAALRRLGHEVKYATPGGEGRLILFGANNLRDDLEHPAIPADAIVYNSEQLAALKDPTFFLQGWIGFKDHVLWEYSEANMVALKTLDLRGVLCPVGYVPEMEVVPQATDEDIDVLFYGSVAGPRREVLDALDASGLHVVRLFGVYGAERDAYVARSKVVLNLHYYPRGVFEIFRVSHLLANRKCVLTESGGCDAGLEAFAERSCAYVPRARIVDECRRLVADATARRAQAERGYEEFKKVDLVENVRRAVEQS
jgi:hypothetical protein